jgi:hypothetical protein
MPSSASKAGLLAAGAIALALPALAQAPGKYVDLRQQMEAKDGVPPEGAPIAKGTPRGPGSLTGVWNNREAPYGVPTRDQAVHTDKGEIPPLRPEAAALFEKRMKDAEAGHPYSSTKSRCLPAGVPAMMLSPHTMSVRIIEQPKDVTILVEELNNFRQIFLNAKHKEDAAPAYMGDSVGHWEGDTLVVETTNIDTDTGVDNVGTPHSDALKVTERFRRITPMRLEYKVTIDDPKTFTRPWSLPRRTLELEPTTHLNEYLCANQRNPVDTSGRTGVQLSK